MAESNKISLDSLPAEVLLKILGNLDGLPDKSNVAQISLKFNRLANDKSWRRSIFLSWPDFLYLSDDSQGFLRFEDLIEELSESTRLKTLVIPTYERYYDDSVYDINSIIGIIDILLTICKELSNYNGVCTLSKGYYMTRIIFVFSPQCVDADIHRILRKHPTDITGVQFKGNDSIMMEKLIELTSDTMKEVVFKSPITMALLNSLSKCKDLKLLSLRGNLDASNIRKESIPKIRCEVLDLTDFTYSPVEANNQVIADLFYSDKLNELHIPMQYMTGIENIWSISPSLSKLTIEVNPNLNIPSFKNFCTKLFCDLDKESCSQCFICFNQIKRELSETLEPSLRQNLKECDFHIEEEISYNMNVFTYNKQKIKSEGPEKQKWEFRMTGPRGDMFAECTCLRS